MELIRKYKQGKLTIRDIRKLNHCVIFLMVLVAISSIIWSIMLHMLSADFNEGIVSAKVVFKDRDITKLDHRSQEIFQQDLENLGQLIYKPSKETSQPLRSDSPTKKPEYKFKHIYESKVNAPILSSYISQQKEQESLPTTTTTTAAPEIVLNAEADHNFLTTKCIDVVTSRWSNGIGVGFVYNFPVISEIVAIVWTSMCLIFQTGNKKTSILPKPWRIVVPSIVIFALMSLASVAYAILTNGYVKRLCSHLRQGLTNPQGVSCGTAIALLRPQIHEHSVSHDVYLDVFRASYIISTVLWILALLVVVLRYSLAIDFRLVDIDDYFDHRDSSMQPAYMEVQSSPRHLIVETQARPKSEDDYQSAKSRLSELAAPLLELKAGDPGQSIATVS